MQVLRGDCVRKTDSAAGMTAGALKSTAICVPYRSMEIDGLTCGVTRVMKHHAYCLNI